MDLGALKGLKGIAVIQKKRNSQKEVHLDTLYRSTRLRTHTRVDTIFFFSEGTRFLQDSQKEVYLNTSMVAVTPLL